MADRRVGFLVAGLVLLLDQAMKYLVTGPLGLTQMGDQLYITDFFNFTYTENRGISLGMLHASSDSGRWLLVAMTSVIAVGVAYWIGREKLRGDQAALGMVLGGALGNIIDRVRLGYVVDYADLHFGEVRPFMVFNIADAAISIAVVILLLRAFVTRKERREETIDHA